MQTMSPLDASFLHVEDAVTHMHIGSVGIFEGPVTTNVPGPQQPLYLAGRRMLAAFPFVPLADTCESEWRLLLRRRDQLPGHRRSRYGAGHLRGVRGHRSRHPAAARRLRGDGRIRPRRRHPASATDEPADQDGRPEAAGMDGRDETAVTDGRYETAVTDGHAEMAGGTAVAKRPGGRRVEPIEQPSGRAGVMVSTGGR